MLVHMAEVRASECRTDLSEVLTRRRVECYRLVIVANRAVVEFCYVLRKVPRPAHTLFMVRSTRETEAVIVVEDDRTCLELIRHRGTAVFPSESQRHARWLSVNIGCQGGGHANNELGRWKNNHRGFSPGVASPGSWEHGLKTVRPCYPCFRRSSDECNADNCKRSRGQSR